MYELKVIGELLLFFGTVSGLLTASILIAIDRIRDKRKMKALSNKEYGETFRKIFSLLLDLCGIIVIIPGAITTAPVLSKVLAGIIMIIVGAVYYFSPFKLGCLRLIIVLGAVIFLAGVVIFVGNIFSFGIAPVFYHFFPNYVPGCIGSILLSFNWKWTAIGFAVYILGAAMILIPYMFIQDIILRKQEN